MKRAASLALATLVAACGGTTAAPAPKAATPRSAEAGPTSVPDPEALAYDCGVLDKALASFDVPPADAMTATAIAASYTRAAVALRVAKLETRDVRETSRRMADVFEKVAANGPTLEKDFATLRSSLLATRDQVAVFDTAVVAAAGTCTGTKVKDPVCVDLKKVMATSPILGEGDLDGMSVYREKLEAFRKDASALRVADADVKRSLEVVDTSAAAVMAAVSRVTDARAAFDEHSFTSEMKGLSGRLDALCPRRGAKPAEGAPSGG